MATSEPSSFQNTLYLAAAPRDYRRRHVDLPHHVARLPVVEDQEVLPARAQHLAAKNLLHLEGRLDRVALLEVAEELQPRGRLGGSESRGEYLLDGVVAVAVGGPDGLEGGAEALGAEDARGGDGVLAVAAEKHEAAVVVVVEGLGEELAATQVEVKETSKEKGGNNGMG